MPAKPHDIRFQLIYSKRKTLEITVNPDGSVAVKAPLGTDEGLIADRVNKRARWIKNQVGYFAQYDPRTPQRRFVGGESHLYLGRKYRLKISRAETDEISLDRGFFYIRAVDPAPEYVAKLLEDWYRNKAHVHFAQVLDECWRYFQAKVKVKPVLKIRKMKMRWGSLSRGGGMTLNLELIKAPRECIEYVVVHELCHLLHHDHGKEFYNLLEGTLPDWTKRKHKLEMALS